MWNKEHKIRVWNKLDTTKERIDELEDRSVAYIESAAQKANKMENAEEINDHTEKI